MYSLMQQLVVLPRSATRRQLIPRFDHQDVLLLYTSRSSPPFATFVNFYQPLFAGMIFVLLSLVIP